MLRHTHYRSLWSPGWFTAFILPLLVVSDIAAQSGRRAAQTLPSNPASPASSEPSTKKYTGPELAKKITLLVAMQPTSMKFAAEAEISASFVKRLQELNGLEVTSLGQLKHDEAIKRARAESEAFVVLMHFDVDSFQSGTIILNSHDLEVKYSVFAPQTGKQQSHGKVYFQTVGGGRLRKSEWPTGTPIKITTEAAGIEAADQLYSWLSLLVGLKQKL
jgi:hypothetical protein